MSILKCISKNLQDYAQDAAFVALTSLTADLKSRIHNYGEKTVGQIGNYQTPAWISKRREQGLQVRYVDLQYSGQLFRDLSTGQSKGQAVMGFLSDLSFDIHEGQEERYGPIWEPTADEQDDLVSRFRKRMNERIKNCK